MPRIGPALLGDGQSQALPPRSCSTAVPGVGGSNVCQLLAHLMPQFSSESSSAPRAARMPRCPEAGLQGSAVSCLLVASSDSPLRAGQKKQVPAGVSTSLLHKKRGREAAGAERAPILRQQTCPRSRAIGCQGSGRGRARGRARGRGSAAEEVPWTSLRGGGGHRRRLYVCRPAAEAGWMFPPALTSPAPSTVTHLLIAAVVCHIHLGSFLTDLK